MLDWIPCLKERLFKFTFTPKTRSFYGRLLTSKNKRLGATKIWATTLVLSVLTVAIVSGVYLLLNQQANSHNVQNTSGSNTTSENSINSDSFRTLSGYCSPISLSEFEIGSSTATISSSTSSNASKSKSLEATLHLITMNQNSSATLCIQYNLPSSINVSQWTPGNVSLAASAWTAYVNSSGAGLNPVSPNMIDVSSYPNWILVNASDNLGSITVFYTITAFQGSSGFYDLQFPNLCPNGILLAVGHNASDITYSDFKADFFLPNCVGNQLVSEGVIVGGSGLEMGTITGPEVQSWN